MAGRALPAARRARDEHRAPDARRARERPQFRQPHVRYRQLRRADGEALRNRLQALRFERSRRRARAAGARLHAVSTAFPRGSAKVVLMRILGLALGWGWAATIVWLSLTPRPPQIDVQFGDKI